jgi:hypothetical protein
LGADDLRENLTEHYLQDAPFARRVST